MSNIQDFYAGKSLMLTGGTGFMGKVILEKLARSCPKIGKIYLLVRSKGESTPQERVNTLLESELFALARRENPDFVKKVIAVGADLEQENFALTPTDLAELIENVNIVFHVAATVRFNEKLKIALEANVLAVRRMLDFCKKLKHGVAFVHTSTAYAHTTRQVIEEVVYPSSFDPVKLINLIEALDPTMVDSLTPHLVASRPNTYTFTKSIAESLVAMERPNIPTAIVRPSIIGSAWKEPYPGWIDNFNGPAGLSLAAGTGVMRVIPGNGQTLADIVPVDSVANFTITVPWYIAQQSVVPDEVRVFNLTSGGMTQCNWGTWAKYAAESYRKYPLEKSVFRRPRVAFAHGDSWEFWFRRQFWHILPGVVTDALTRMVGKPPRMSRNFQKLDRAVEEYRFFTTNGWKWETRNGQAMMASMCEEDKVLFDFDMSKLHWPTYIENQCVGVKKFLMREDMARIDIARKNQRQMMFLNFLSKCVVMALLVKFLLPYLRRRGLVRSAWLLLIPTLLMVKA